MPSETGAGRRWVLSTGSGVATFLRRFGYIRTSWNTTARLCVEKSRKIHRPCLQMKNAKRKDYVHPSILPTASLSVCRSVIYERLTCYPIFMKFSTELPPRVTSRKSESLENRFSSGNLLEGGKAFTSVL